MSLKKRALKAYQSQLKQHPLPKPRPINLPIAKHNENYDHSERDAKIYDKWYLLDESDNKKSKRQILYERNRNLAVLDIGLKIAFGLTVFGLMIVALLR